MNNGLLLIGLGWRTLTSVVSFAAVACAVYAALRMTRGRLQQILVGYSNEVGAASARATSLVDIGPLGVIASWLSDWAVSSFGAPLLLGGVVVALTISFLSSSVVVGAGLLALLIGIPFTLNYIVDVAHRRRIHMIEEALPDATTLLASSMGAGLPMHVALASLAANTHGPLATEARIAANEMSTGATVREAMQGLIRRTPSKYVSLFGAAVSVHVDSGGNLPEALREIGGALTRILLAEDEVRAKTSGSRREGVLASLVPIGIMPILFIFMPELAYNLFARPLGQIIFVVAAIIYVYCVRGLQGVSNREV